jgi:hypothetical protein
MAHVLGDAVAAPPTDGVTRVRFSPTASNYLLASSWDGVGRRRGRRRGVGCPALNRTKGPGGGGPTCVGLQCMHTAPAAPRLSVPWQAAGPLDHCAAERRGSARGAQIWPPRLAPTPLRQTARLYDPTGAPRGVYVHAAPLLDCSFEQEGVFYSGGLDCRVAR